MVGGDFAFIDYLMGSVCVLIGSKTGYILASILGWILPVQWQQTDFIRLMKLRAENGQEFYLSIQEAHSRESAVVFYTLAPNGFPVMCTRLSRKSEIYEENREDGVLSEYKGVFNPPWLHWVVFDPGKKLYRLNVPEGTVNRPS
jgi:hypothetical protein